MQRLVYILGLMMLAWVAPAQVYGPLPYAKPDTTRQVYVLLPGTAAPAPIAATDDCLPVATDTTSNTLAIDSSCLVIDCLVKVERLLPRYIFNEDILENISPAAREYTAEYREMPPPEVHVREVVAEWEVVPLKRDRHGAWLFTILTIQFFLIVYLRVGFIRYAEEQYRSFFNLNISQQVFREQELSMPFPALLLTINGVTSYAILLYLGLEQLGVMPGLSDWTLFSISLGIIFAIAALKYMLMWVTGAIFPFRDEINFFNFNFFLNIKILGTLLLPINFIIAYAPAQFTDAFIWTGVSILALSYLGLAIKGLAIAKNYLAFYKFHFIVYICSLEIAPVLILVKIVQNAAQ